jgi:hypothetical protein
VVEPLQARDGLLWTGDHTEHQGPEKGKDLQVALALDEALLTSEV